MKRLTFLLAFSFVFFYGCNKQETTPTTDNQQVEATDEWAYRLNLDGDNAEGILVTLDELPGNQSNTGSSDLKQNNSAHTHGDFEYGSTSFTWSGTQNNGGTHGSATLTINSTFMTMTTECIMLEGNEAVYGGLITEIVNPIPFAGFVAGNIVYIKVIDNGQGNNAPADQFNGLIKVSATSKCGVWTPDTFPDTFYGFDLILDVPEPGSVKVNN